MALKKPIKQINGVNTEYHRIAMIKIDVNQTITLLVESYIDESGRQTEKDYAEGKINSFEAFPYKTAEYIDFTYDENEDMFKGNVTQKVYNWLKKRDKFKDALDI